MTTDPRFEIRREPPPDLSDVGQDDALVERIRAEVEFSARCIATGGLAPLIAKETRTIEATDDLLTLKGLKILYQRNA